MNNYSEKLGVAVGKIVASYYSLLVFIINTSAQIETY